MQDYIEIGPAPSEEDCVQVGTDDYAEHARVECHRFMELVRKQLGEEPQGARLAVKSFPHDFGNYLEVVCFFDEENKKAIEYAFRCESNGPKTWSEK